jgi:hypothetical protein
MREQELYTREGQRRVHGESSESRVLARERWTSQRVRWRAARRRFGIEYADGGGDGDGIMAASRRPIHHPTSVLGRCTKVGTSQHSQAQDAMGSMQGKARRQDVGLISELGSDD